MSSIHDDGAATRFRCFLGPPRGRQRSSEKHADRRRQTADESKSSRRNDEGDSASVQRRLDIPRARGFDGEHVRTPPDELARFAGARRATKVEHPPTAPPREPLRLPRSRRPDQTTPSEQRESERALPERRGAEIWQRRERAKLRNLPRHDVLSWLSRMDTRESLRDTGERCSRDHVTFAVRAPALASASSAC